MKKIIAFISIATILIGVAVFIVGNMQVKTLKDAIASSVNANPDTLLINLPPHTVRLPGTILAPQSSSFLVYASGNLEDESFLKGETFSIEASLNDLSNVSGNFQNSLLSSAFDNNGALEVNLQIQNAYIAELPVSALKKRVLGNQLIDDAINRGIVPIIVSRSYIGEVRYIVRAAKDSGIDILAKISKKAHDIQKMGEGSFNFEDKIESQKEISFSIKSPIVFAYEAMSVSRVATDLSDQSELKIYDVSDRGVKEIGEENTKVHSKLKKRWGAITISSGHYDNFASINVPQAVEASNLMSQFFESYDPVFSKKLNSSKDSPLTDESLLDWSVQLTMELLENPVDHLLVYYSGHGLTLPSGEVILLQGNINKDYAEKAATNTAPSMSQLGDGLLLVEQLYNALSMTNVPFTLLIDTCHPNDEMAEALTRVSMSLGNKDGSGIYYTGDEVLITSELSDIGKVMREIGSRFEYRQQSNAVIFSSKPGAKSIFKPNPVDPYGLQLPPLAARILRYKDFMGINNNRLALAEIIRLNTDSINGVGEVSLDGSITWSNLDNMLLSLDQQ
jgi:hypothetical protein